MKSELPEFFSRQQLAAFLNVCTRTIQRLEKEGQIQSVRFGRAVRYRRADIESFIDNQTTERFLK